MKKEFFNGVSKGIPIFVGYFSAAVTFGILAVSCNLTFAEAVLFSGMNFTGAAQFMALNLIKADASMIEIIISFSLVNLRYFLMSASLQERLAYTKKWQKPLTAFGITDETFSVSYAMGEHISPAFFAGIVIISWLGWVGGTTAGFIGGEFLPAALQAAMGVALYALFAAVLAPDFKKGPEAIVVAGSAGIINLLSTKVFHIAEGWSFVIAMLIGALVGVIAFPDKDEESQTDFDKENSAPQALTETSNKCEEAVK